MSEVLRAETFLHKVLPGSKGTSSPEGQAKPSDILDDLKLRPYTLSVPEAYQRMTLGLDRHLSGVPLKFIVGTNVLNIDFDKNKTAAEQIQALLKKKRVTDQQVLSLYGPVDPEAKTSANSTDYLHYALLNFSSYYSDLQKVLGPLPLRPDGSLKPQLVRRYREIQKKLDPKDPWAALVEEILAPKQTPHSKLVAYFKIRAQEQALQAQILLTDQGKLKNAAHTQQAVAAWAQTQGLLFELDPYNQDPAQVALVFYQAGALSRQGGQEKQAKNFYQRGIEILRGVPGIEKDGFLLKLLGDGLQEAGHYPAAVQAYDQAFNVGIPRGDLSREEWVSINRTLDKSLLAPTLFAVRQSALQKELPKGYLARLEKLQEKAAQGKLNPREAKELAEKQTGLKLLSGINRIGLAALRLQEDSAAKLPSYLLEVRNGVLAHLTGEQGGQFGFNLLG